ncbi:hypothetical protein SAMN05421788_103277 [Filimonas lacunae]|uniref:Uncharacterized protein n=1 Tax=Filimonas lacunae TaxID=477680 RepID=A0A173MJW7_9BACT|nr:hypothetical protein [Filimonas lacunae]BAV07932.1 hypothetical protein FLA_3964 [Filimonas lacunae]SIT06774.1 hypothetical protein SAMN05421788_103277 [Filimonas lacunae]
MSTAKVKAESGGRNLQKLSYLKAEFDAERISSWEQVFAFYAVSTIAVDLGIHYNTFQRKVKTNRFFTLDELIRFAGIINVDHRLVINFVVDQIVVKKGKAQPG